MILLQGFLLGVIATASITAAVYFFRFWERTRDRLFLAFAGAFLVEGLSRIALLFVAAPAEGDPIIYLVRLLAVSLIVVAIVRKNSGPQDR